MKLFAAITLLSALVACGTAPAPTPPVSSTWLPFQRGLPTQATVLALAVDLRDPARIIAGTYDTTGAYITLDGARSWRVFNAGLERTPILAMLYAGDSLLAGTTAGLYRLVDQTWTRIDAVPAVAIYSLSRDANGAIYVGTDTRGIFASTDSGSTWAHIPGLDGEIALSVASVASSPGKEASISKQSAPGDAAPASDKQTLFVGTSGHGAFVTRDRGKTWQTLYAFSGDYVSLITVDPRDGKSLYLRTRGGLFRSRDDGVTWQQLRGGIETELVNALLFDSFSSRIYVATSGRGVFASDDDGASWLNLNAGLPPGVATLALAQVDAQTLLAGTQTGVYITRDAGRSWSVASDGVGAPVVHTLALNPQSGALYAATETSLYRSDASGNFEQVGDAALRAPTLSIAIAPSNPQVIYAGVYRHGIFVSRDGGASWNAAGDIFSGRLSPTGLAVDPQNAQNVFARVLFERIYKSADGGDAWHAVWTGMPDTAEVETLSIAPSDPTRMYAGTNSGLYVSRDAGESWTLRGFADQTLFAFWIDPRDPNAVLAGATDGLYRTNDSGESWTPIALAQISVTALARDASGNLYAGTKYNGVWISRDNGKTFARFGLNDDGVIALAVDDVRGILYAATTRGIFKSELNR
jgi:photosystem II stability/assembly factor-like uncharacterized protein